MSDDTPVLDHKNPQFVPLLTEKCIESVIDTLDTVVWDCSFDEAVLRVAMGQILPPLLRNAVPLDQPCPLDLLDPVARAEMERELSGVNDIYRMGESNAA